MIAGSSVDSKMTGRASRETSRAVGFEEDEVSTGSPRRKRARMAEKVEALGDIRRPVILRARANVPRGHELGLKCVAAGVRCWGYFCVVRGRRHIPPSKGAVLARSAYPSARRTSQQYRPRLNRACSLLGYGVGRKTKAASQAAEGLARSGDRIRAPKPAVPRGLF